jgi:transposase
MLRQISKLKNLLKKTSNEINDFLASPQRKVFFFDESRFGLKPTLGRCWARKGVRVSAAVNPSYKNFYVYSSVSPSTGEPFHLFLPNVNTEMMNIYIREMAAAYAESEIMLVMDQAGWHKSKKLEVPQNIHFHLLPPYSPELNPVEKLWQWLKRHICRNRLFSSEDELMDALAIELSELEPHRLKNLCHCSYLFH